MKIMHFSVSTVCAIGKTGNMLQIVVRLSMVVKLSAPTAVTQNILSIVFYVYEFVFFL
jgi:hypothetical protein